jgi:signal transduction histidine kinase
MLPVEVRADGIGRYPQDLEAAVYFCVLEALQNVQKYADASRVVVHLDGRDGDLSFEVQDDGKGFDPEASPRGNGLNNMADRLEALGGMLTIHRASVGMVVSGTLPAVAIGATPPAATVGATLP